MLETSERCEFGMRLATVNDERAQGVIEFAFIVTVLMLLFLGTVDYARFLYYDSAITSAARVGAETASNHCPFAASSCGTTSSPTSDTFVLWSTYCEANPSVTLQPAYSTCDQGTTGSWSPSCGAGSCSPCISDICVSPSDSSRSSGSTVSVTVGYMFHPLSFFLDWAFQEQSCFAGDTVSTNHHTLCATSSGRVS